MKTIESSIELKIELFEQITDENFDLFKSKFYDLLKQFNDEISDAALDCGIAIEEQETILSEKTQLQIAIRQNILRRKNSKSL